MTGGEDFSFFAEKVPALYLGLGVKALTAVALSYLGTHSTP